MPRITPYLLWAALLATLAGTLYNTTWAFSTVNAGNMTFGFVQAVAADLGLVALAATLAERRARSERVTWLWVAVGGFVAVSTYASYLHSYAQATPLDAPLSALRPALLGAFLPLMLFALVEVVSHARRASAREAPVEQPGCNAPLGAQEGQSATESAPAIIYVPSTPAPLAAENAAQAADVRASVAVTAPSSAPTTNGHKYACAHCDYTATTQQALAAHSRKHKEASA